MKRKAQRQDPYSNQQNNMKFLNAAVAWNKGCHIFLIVLELLTFAILQIFWILCIFCKFQDFVYFAILGPSIRSKTVAREGGSKTFLVEV